MKEGIIKIKHLGVRGCWEFYSDHAVELGIEVEGNKLSNIFKAWLAVKKIYNNRKKWSKKRLLVNKI